MSGLTQKQLVIGLVVIAVLLAAIIGIVDSVDTIATDSGARVEDTP